MLTLGFAPTMLCSWIINLVDLLSCQPRFVRDFASSTIFWVFLSACWSGWGLSLLPLPCGLLWGEDRLRWHSSHQVRDAPFSPLHWRRRKAEEMVFAVLLRPPLWMHHCITAWQLRPCWAGGGWEGGQVNTWTWMLAVRSISTSCGRQDGHPSWVHPQDRFPLRSCVSLHLKAGATSNGLRAC